ncbi:MAG: hypothetical protein COB02_11675 [Candidatus Cloacimonadota bacterium]|nr:MAG: hypothetical protein COB02_11675 [Candidatus Cloacimonadota bacterium]
MLKLWPDWLLRKFEKNQLRGNFNGIVLFADLSGFTKTTEKFMQQGFEGVELLSETINSIFEPLVKHIHNHDGFIANFAGDAFTAIFTHQDKIKVLECAFHLIDSLKNNPLFSIKVGIGFGQVDWVILSTKTSSTYYFQGKALKGATDSELRCEIDKVVVSKTFSFEELDEFSFDEIDSGFKQVFKLTKLTKIINKKLESNSLCTIKKLLPQALHFQDDIGEFRNVISVFISMDIINGQNSVELFIKELIAECDVQGGLLNLLDFGDKGAMALVLFGAPISYEKMSHRACRFILNLQKLKTLRFRAGLSRGNVYAGPLGCKERCTYSVLGEKVNLAARLMMKGDFDDLYVDQQIYNSSKSDFDFESMGLSSFKGFSKKMEFFKLKKRSYKTIQNDKVLVGREKELKKLSELILRRESWVHIVANAGVGKSLLIKHFIEINPQIEWMLIKAESEQFSTLLSIRNFVLSLLGLAVPDSKKLKNSLDFLGENNRKFNVAKIYLSFSHFLGLSVNDLSFLSLSPQVRLDLFIQHLCELIKIKSKDKTCYILIEDLHWLSVQSREILSKVFVQCKEIFLFTTTRPEQFDYAQFYGKKFFELKLGLLKNHFVSEIIVNKLENKPDSFLLNLLILKSEGNPFYLEQLLHYLIDHKLLNKVNKTIKLKDTKISLPNEIGELVVSRVDQLSKKVQKTLKVASILGRQFSLIFVTKVLETGCISNKLISLEEQDLAVNIEKMDYLFTHGLVQETIYKMQLVKHRKTLHKKVAFEIKNQISKSLASNYFDLAYHYEKADLKMKAFNAYHQCAKKSQEENFLSLQGKALKSCLNIALKNSQKLQIQADLCSHSFNIGDLSQAQQYFKKCLNLLSKVRTIEIKLDVMLQLAKFCISQGEIKEAEQFLMKGKKLSKKYNQNYYSARYISQIGRINQSRSKYKIALEYFKEACKIAQNKKYKTLEISNKQLIAESYNFLGQHKKTLSLLESLSKEVQEDNFISQRYSIYNLMGRIYFNTGHHKKAGDFYQKCLEISQKIGLLRNIAASKGNLGTYYWVTGDYDKAMKLFQDDLKIMTHLNDKAGMSTAHNMVGGMYMDFGDYNLAIKHYKSQYEIAASLKEGYDLAISSQGIGYLYKLLLNFKECYTWLDYSIKFCKKNEIKLLLGFSLYYKTLALCLQNKFVEALPLSLEALKISREIANKDTMSFRIYLMTEKLKKHCKEQSLDKTEVNVLSHLKLEVYTKYWTQSELSLNETEAFYELWFLTRKEKYKIKAIDGFKKLYKNRPDGEYKTKWQEIENDKRVL